MRWSIDISLIDSFSKIRLDCGALSASRNSAISISRFFTTSDNAIWGTIYRPEIPGTILTASQVG